MFCRSEPLPHHPSYSLSQCLRPHVIVVVLLLQRCWRSGKKQTVKLIWRENQNKQHCEIQFCMVLFYFVIFLNLFFLFAIPSDVFRETISSRFVYNNRITHKHVYTHTFTWHIHDTTHVRAHTRTYTHSILLPNTEKQRKYFIFNAWSWKSYQDKTISSLVI